MCVSYIKSVLHLRHYTVWHQGAYLNSLLALTPPLGLVVADHSCGQLQHRCLSATLTTPEHLYYFLGLFHSFQLPPGVDGTPVLLRGSPFNSWGAGGRGELEYSHRKIIYFSPDLQNLDSFRFTIMSM